jgi:prepilin signal peptidase PulO-like enzyme (type II secretory pathway)
MFTFYLIFFVICGAIIGSFTNCFIWRLYQDESLMGRSYCPKCRKQIHWYDNVPVISFLVLRGKCRHCQQGISWQYPAVEISTALLFGAVFLSASSGLSGEWGYLYLGDPHFIAGLVKSLFIIFIFTVVFVYDLRWYLVSDKAVLPAAAILFGLNLYLGFSWTEMLLSAFLGASFFLAQYLISRGKWIGGGDIRLGILIGCAFAKPGLLALTLMLAYLIGSAIGLVLLAGKKKGWKSELPLGVFLAMASLITLFFGQAIISWYLGLA